MQLLHSKILGQGRPLLILHGFLGMSDNWKTLGNQFAKDGFEVHLIDQRNHGKSFHSVDFDYTFLAKDVEHYLDHYSLGSAIILGHSMGGKTAMQFACDHPHRVTKLLVADIAPKEYPPHHQHILDALALLNFNEITSRAQADQELAKHLPEFGIRQFLLKNLYWIEKEKLGLRFNLDVLKNSMDAIGENIGSIQSYTGSTLFLRGDKSEYILQNDYPQITKHFPKASIESVVNAGHWLHAENPKDFYLKAIDFLNR